MPELHDRSTSERLLDVHEAAELLRIKPRTLYKWSYKRKIPTIHLGRALRFRLSTLLELLDQLEEPAVTSNQHEG